LPAWISDLSLTEFIAAFERNDLGVFALFMLLAPNQIRSAHALLAMSARTFGYRAIKFGSMRLGQHCA
jgi:hypothetical protein